MPRQDAGRLSFAAAGPRLDGVASHACSITEVAQAVGFGDLPRFDKLFRRYTGMTPSAYRLRRVAADAKK